MLEQFQNKKSLEIFIVNEILDKSDDAMEDSYVVIKLLI